MTTLGLNDRQWLVVWIALALTLATWWSTAAESARARVETDPVIAEIQKSHLEWTQLALEGPTEQQAGNAKVAKAFLDSIYPRARAVRWSEYQPRVAGTVIALAAFIIWFIERRK